MLDVGGGQDHALVAGEAPLGADVEEALDLLVHAAHRLHLPVLVDRAGDGDRLRQRLERQRREQRAELGERDPAGRHGTRDRR